MVACPKAVDRSDTRNNKTASFEKKIGSINIEFTSDELREIDDASSEIKVQGKDILNICKSW
jgi:hypothetical protein